MAAGSNLGCPKITSYHFISIPQFYFVIFFTKWAAGGHFGCRKLTSDGISGHFRSICNFYFKQFLQNGCRRPFWMSEIHFRSHFWPFQIDRPFCMSEIHLRWYFWPFQIHTELIMTAKIRYDANKLENNVWYNSPVTFKLIRDLWEYVLFHVLPALTISRLSVIHVLLANQTNRVPASQYKRACCDVITSQHAMK